MIVDRLAVCLLLAASFLAKTEQACGAGVLESKDPASGTDKGIRVLIYDTNDSLKNEESAYAALFDRKSREVGITTTVFGAGSQFKGFGSKYVAVTPLLQKMDPESLVVISDGRDVVLNVPNMEQAPEALDTFVNAFHSLIRDHPGAVVISAEAQCCVAALSHAKPGDYFSATTGTREQRACASGEADCLWRDGNTMTFLWEAFMIGLAKTRTNNSFTEDVYLNAGLMAGYPQDLLKLIDRLQLEASEDDQAVLTDLMYHDPSSIILDYRQELFGNNRWTDGLEDGCIFGIHDGTLMHKKTGTNPLIVHGSGRFFECLDKLSSVLWPSLMRLKRRTLRVQAEEEIFGELKEKHDHEDRMLKVRTKKNYKLITKKKTHGGRERMLTGRKGAKL